MPLHQVVCNNRGALVRRLPLHVSSDSSAPVATPFAFAWVAIGEISVKGFYQWLSLIPLAVMGVIWLFILIARVLDRYGA
jgi:hypothetical protein